MICFLLQDAADGVEAARGENSQGLAGGGGGRGGEMKELGCFLWRSSRLT